MALSQLKRSVQAALQSTAAPTAFALNAMLQLELSREFTRLQSDLRRAMPENPAGHGFKVYSQADEDGILEQICTRLGLGTGVFAEIGCGDGRENNTHYLLLKGWRGVWIDGNPANLSAIRSALPPNARLRLIEALVTRENVVDLLRPELASLGALDILSVDVDGNDLPIAQAAIAAFSPKVVVAEYNAKFPYPMSLGVAYDPRRTWQRDDYHGASLAAWVEGLSPGYGLVGCNVAGTNAFFVRGESVQRFGNYSPEQLYQPARFHLTALQVGHPPTLSFLADLLASEDANRTESSE
jgi:hypothetical protein